MLVSTKIFSQIICCVWTLTGLISRYPLALTWSRMSVYPWEGMPRLYWVNLIIMFSLPSLGKLVGNSIFDICITSFSDLYSKRYRRLTEFHTNKIIWNHFILDGSPIYILHKPQNHIFPFNCRNQFAETEIHFVKNSVCRNWEIHFIETHFAETEKFLS